MTPGSDAVKMPHRTLGRTGISVSEIGFGGWGIGKSMWGRTDDAESMQALHAAFDAGIDYFDTAYAYGHGHSERLIARLFKETGRRATVSTKVPPKNMEWPGHATVRLGLIFPPNGAVLLDGEQVTYDENAGAGAGAGTGTGTAPTETRSVFLHAVIGF